MPAHAHACAGAGPGLGPGAGSGSGPYSVRFFLIRVSRVQVTRSIPAPPSGSEPPRATAVSQPLQTVGRLLWLKRTVATVQTEPLQLLGSDPFTPPGAL